MRLIRDGIPWQLMPSIVDDALSSQSRAEPSSRRSNMQPVQCRRYARQYAAAADANATQFSAAQPRQAGASTLLLQVRASSGARVIDCRVSAVHRHHPGVTTCAPIPVLRVFEVLSKCLPACLPTHPPTYVPTYLPTHPPTYATYATYATCATAGLAAKPYVCSSRCAQADIKQGMREILVDWIFELRQVWSQ